MLLSEFINLSGYFPTENEFETINESYMNSDLNKREFCAIWCKINRKKVLETRAQKKESERIFKETERITAKILKYCRNKKVEIFHTVTESEFIELFHGTDKKVLERTIFDFPKWKGINHDFEPANWDRFRQIHTAAAYGYCKLIK